jgi:hypothetical protein
VRASLLCEFGKTVSGVGGGCACDSNLRVCVSVCAPSRSFNSVQDGEARGGSDDVKWRQRNSQTRGLSCCQSVEATHLPRMDKGRFNKKDSVVGVFAQNEDNSLIKSQGAPASGSR